MDVNVFAIASYKNLSARESSLVKTTDLLNKEALINAFCHAMEVE